MRSGALKQALIAVSALVVLGLVAIVVAGLYKKEAMLPAPLPAVTPIEPVVQKPVKLVGRKIIGRSVEGRVIDAYVYGSGPTHLMFVGGIHGGYEWNSVLLAYQFMDYLKANPNVIPKNLIPPLLFLVRVSLFLRRLCRYRLGKCKHQLPKYPTYEHF